MCCHAKMHAIAEIRPPEDGLTPWLMREWSETRVRGDVEDAPPWKAERPIEAVRK
jgi:hypothetical protein